MKIMIYDWRGGKLLSTPGLNYTQDQEIENASITEVLNITKEILMVGLNVMIKQGEDITRICVSDSGFGQR